MSTRFKNSQSHCSPADDGETVAALVKMLSGMGIDRSRIDAMISKTARPNVDIRSPHKPEIANDTGVSTPARRLA